MSTHRGIPALLGLTVLSTVSACDMIDRARERIGTTDTLAVAGAGTGLMLGLQAPGMLQPGEEAVLRLAVANRTDTTVTQIRLELIVPGWAVPMPPRPGEREVSMVALPDGTTRFAYRMDDSPLESGQTQVIEQRIRVPGADAADTADAPAAPRSRVVRGLLVGADGQALAEVQGEIGLEGSAADTTAARVVDPPDRVGPVRLGMSASAVRQVASARDTTWTHQGTPRQGVWVTLDEGGRLLAALSGDSVTRLEVRDATVRTGEGLGVGSRLEELRSAYGAGCADVDEDVVVVWFARAPGVRFALDTATPQDVAQLRANPDRLPGAARVTRWWLRRDAESCPR
jgi:hypothetical protein